ncbi:MAG: DNA-3-methyladenine glycosylase 2 family protein, partial [Planctomycetes bacterium]|nr:DNA-3-methyladenine glycosylase 2 family protein [Planctomycetota bacterium]
MASRPADLRALAALDPAWRPWIGKLPRYPGFPDLSHPRQRTHYDALAGAIVYQQLSGQAAATIWGRVRDLTPGRHFPRAPELLALAPKTLRGAGLSRAKVLALRDLAARIAAGRLELARLSRMSDERVIEQLVDVRGIGTWTAQMFLMFRLARPDVFAPGDLGLREGIRLLDGRRSAPDERAAERR